MFSMPALKLPLNKSFTYTVMIKKITLKVHPEAVSK